MAKITFMGAGSTVFAKNVIGDCMCKASLHDAEFALYDIDADRLRESQLMLEILNKNINQGRATIKSYLGVETARPRSAAPVTSSTASRSAVMSPPPSSTLKYPRNTASARPSPTPSALAASSAPFAPSR